MPEMIKAKLHSQEKDRIQALRQLQILDSTAEKEFDDLAKIAAQICDVPMALISLVDEERQWFKSKVGFSASETSRDVAFCAHAILGDEPLIVEDASKDERFSNNSVVVEDPGIQFYAGVPILAPRNDLPIGTLCILDHKPRKLSESQRVNLSALAHQVEKLLELRAQVLELRESNRKLIFKNTAFDNLSEGVVVQDSSGEIIEFNNRALTVLGVSANQLLDKGFMNPKWKAIDDDGEILPAEKHPAKVAIQLGKHVRNVSMGINSTSEKLKWLLVSSTPLFLDRGGNATHSVTTFTDNTERKKSLSALHHYSNMAALGEMAGGIAHEINTPLAIIGAATQQVKNFISESSTSSAFFRKKLDLIESTNERISKIVRGLKTISRDSEADTGEIVFIKSIITDSVLLCRERFLINQVELSHSVPQDYPVYVNSTQLSQVVINLLNNAFDAVANLKEKWVKIEVKRDGNRIQILVLDSGFGIKDSIGLKIMQPFFTTKDAGKGSGLGLSLSRSLVEKFSGELSYGLISGHTFFKVSLPIWSETAKEDLDDWA